MASDYPVAYTRAVRPDVPLSSDFAHPQWLPDTASKLSGADHQLAPLLTHLAAEGAEVHGNVGSRGIEGDPNRIVTNHRVGDLRFQVIRSNRKSPSSPNDQHVLVRVVHDPNGMGEHDLAQRRAVLHSAGAVPDAVVKHLVDEPETGGQSPANNEVRGPEPFADWLAQGGRVSHRLRHVRPSQFLPAEVEGSPRSPRNSSLVTAATALLSPRTKKTTTPKAAAPAVVKAPVKQEESSVNPIELFTPSELQQRRAEIEQKFREADGPIDSVERKGLWTDLARVNSRLGNKHEAALSWLNAMWDQHPLPQHMVSEWAAGESPEKGGKLDAQDYDRILSKDAHDANSGRALVSSLLAETNGGKTPPWITQRLPAIQKFVETNENYLPVRAAWLAHQRLSDLLGGDSLGLTRARDRMLKRMYESGTSFSDLPAFLHIQGDDKAHQDAVDFRSNAPQLRDLMKQWASTSPQSHPYVDMLLAHSHARTGNERASEELRQQAHTTLKADTTPVGSLVHSFLGDLFSHRIKQQHTPGDKRDGGLPTDLTKRLNEINTTGLNITNSPSRLAHYVITRMRESLRTLEPQAKIDPYASFASSDHSMVREMEAAKGIKNTDELSAEIDRLHSTYRKHLPTVLPHTLSLAAVTNPSTASRTLKLVPDALNEADPKTQGDILSRAMALAGHFDMRDSLSSLTNETLNRINKHKGDERLDLINAVSGESLKTLRKFGADSDISKLFDGIHTAIGSTTATTPDSKSKLLQSRLGVAGALFHFGKTQQATQTLDDARSAIMDKANGMNMPPYVSLVRSYLNALGSAPSSVRLSRVVDLFKNMKPDRVKDTFTNAQFYSRNHLPIIEDALESLVGRGEADKKWSDADEYLIRRRIHADAKQTLDKEANTQYSRKPNYSELYTTVVRRKHRQ